VIATIAAKFFATAVIVISVLLIVQRYGSRIGGVAAGMPIVIGPGFFFLITEQNAAFVANAAVATLHALNATLFFTAAYIHFSSRLTPVTCTAASSLIWGVTAIFFQLVSQDLVVSLLVFLLSLTILAKVNARRAHQHTSKSTTKASSQTIAIRGLIAGLLVAVAAGGSSTLGPSLSGLIMTFPIGTLMIALALHQRSGSSATQATLSSAHWGMLALAVFVTAIAAVIGQKPPMVTFLAALALSLGTTGLLTLHAIKTSK
jgi:uncharacterized membrane protein (GlpM family)